MTIQKDDIIGNKYGKLTVERYNGNDKYNHITYTCKCDCGNVKTVSRQQLLRKSGNTTSCGCKKNNKAFDNPQFKDLTGQKFGCIEVIEFVRSGHRGNIWLCRCIKCGETKETRSGVLHHYKLGYWTSCGCDHYRKGKEARHYKGYKNLSGTLWSSIMSNAKARNLEFEITKEYAYDIFEKQNEKCALSGEQLTLSDVYKEKTSANASLDRIDSSRGYVKGNVQWITKKLNSMKSNMDDLGFRKLCQRISNHSISLGIINNV